ncbi:MAG: VCBS repeat-containing protein, partial [Roseomonas sp.]|nr:VCBS repeat-containing protein [Roseomonas sp.]
PVLTGFGPGVTFAENTVNAAPQLLDSDVEFTAVDSLAGGRLVVGGLLAEDRVSILSEGSGAGQIGVSGSTISYGGVTIGTATGGVGGDFTVTFASAVTGAAVDALIQRLAYGNISDTPTATRSLTLDVVDAVGRLAAAPTAQFTALTGSANPFSGIDVGSRSAPSFVDLDGDRRLDLVAGEYFGALRAWRNTGSGFTALTGSVNPFNGIDVGYTSTPTFVDLDNDRRLDLVAGEYFGALRAWRNTGSGFSALTGSANPLNGIDVGTGSTPSFVDLDGDGRLDLVSGANDGALRAWRNTGTGSGFFALTGSANPFNGIDVGFNSTPSFVDLDGDGRLDLVAGEYFGALRAWRNTASGFIALTGSANPFNGIDVGYWSTPSFVDLDGDGRLDLVLGGGGDTLLAWRNIPSINVTVTAQNEALAITSEAAAVSAENRPAGDIIYQATATGPDVGATLNWSLSGIDAAQFTIDATTGAVRFRTSPNFEAPADTGGNNVYDLIVIATDNVFSPAVQAVAVTVTDAVGPTQLGTAGPDALIVGAENAWLSGLGGNDTLTGGAGRDTLDGGGGNDVFVIGDSLDLIIETSGGGADTIITSVSMTMPDHVETLRIAAGISDITITGGAGNDMLIGNGLANNFNGGAGDDVILAGNVTVADIHALFTT